LIQDGTARVSETVSSDYVGVEAPS
jgi:hypothetical protein